MQVQELSKDMHPQGAKILPAGLAMLAHVSATTRQVLGFQGFLGGWHSLRIAKPGKAWRLRVAAVGAIHGLLDAAFRLPGRSGIESLCGPPCLFQAKFWSIYYGLSGDKPLSDGIGGA